MRFVVICAVALSLVFLQCGNGGGGGTDEGTGGQDVAGDGQTGADVGADSAQDVPGGGDDVPAVVDVKPPPDAGDGGPGPDPDVPDGGSEIDVPVTECTTVADCDDLVTGLCTVADCVDGRCVVGQKDCDDEDDCTFDVCNDVTGQCAHTPNPECGCLTDADCPPSPNACALPHCEIPADREFGTCGFVASTAGCDDNDPCTVGERCTAVDGPRVADCAGGTPRDCGDGDDNTLDWCDPQGQPTCRNQPLDDLPACPGGQGDCPSLAGCVAFECDGDAADPRCQPVNRTGTCNDGNFCTVDDTCQAGRCVGGAPRDCDDGIPATCDACVPGAGECSHTVCETPCTSAQTCYDLLGPPAAACRQWLCPLGSCRDVRVPDETSCEDGAFCTVDDFCRNGACQPGPPNACDDDNPVTADTCNEDLKRCEHGEDFTCGTGCNTGSDCDDGDPCTTDACLTFVFPTVCTCTPRTACHCDPAAPDADASCEDGFDVTIDSCVGPDHPEFPEGFTYPGYCLHELQFVCNEACNGPDDDAACDDGDKCTFDTCEVFDPEEGSYCCIHPVQGPPTCAPCEEDADCTDANPCTLDRCGADGRCDPPGAPEPGCAVCRSDDDCTEDDDPCTTAVCNRGSGECSFVNNNTGCDDGDVCTINDVCDDGVCAGEPRVCDDGNDCTADRCDPQDGCVSANLDPLPDHCRDCQLNPAICNDYDPCTVDRCAVGSVCQNDDLNVGQDTALCVPVPCHDELDCDDGNPCTFDRCEPAEPDPDGDGPIAPVSACVYTENPVCEVPTQLRCTEVADCPLSDCIPDSPAAFCQNPTPECPHARCDAHVGCRYLPTVACPFGECTPATAWNDCWDQSPCTVDECDPETFACVPVEERRSAHPADSLYDVCYACQTVADCPDVEEFDIEDPCVTIECLKPAQAPEGDTFGVCHAYVDQTLHPNRCEDYDLCTLDVCLEGGGCTHTPRSADCQLCTTNGDCDDLNECTEDTCDYIEGSGVGFTCTHAPIPNCTPCRGHADCPGFGGTFCDESRCSGGICTLPSFGSDPTREAVCLENAGCTVPADCAPQDGIESFCTPAGDCIYFPDPTAPTFRCTGVEQCITLEPCQRVVSCTAGACVFEPIPGCTPQTCTSWDDCDDGRPCTLDFCTAEGQCTVKWDDICCDTATDCVELFSTDSHCQSITCGPDGACHMVPFADEARCGNELCETDADCQRRCDPEHPDSCQSFCFGPECYDWPCAQAACNAFGRCVWFDGDCKTCSDDLDCLDASQCTLDRCVEGACTHTPDPACEPVACDADMICDSGDPCIIGLCLSGTCLWMDSPLCE